MSTPSAHQPRSILLTGATGSLGGYLCAELLAGTTATVHCLIRARDTFAARTRLQQRLADLDDSPPHSEHRAIPVAGDVTSPRLGLTAGEFDALAVTTDTILHSAAQVDLGAGYDELAPANLGAMHTLLALARRRLHLTGHPPAIHHISTIGALLNARALGREQVDETTAATEQTAARFGYAASKAAAEVVLRQAAERDGLPVTIHRPGVVTGHSRTGRTSSADVLTPLLWAVVTLRAAPDVDQIVPAERVDVAARAVVRLLHHPDHRGRTYHLVHPRSFSLRQMFDALRRAGHTLDTIPPEQWWQRVQQHADQPRVWPLTVMADAARYMLALDSAHRAPHVRSDITWRSLAENGMSPPPLDDEFLDRLAAHLAPPAPRARAIPAAIPPSPPPVRIDAHFTPCRQRPKT